VLFLVHRFLPLWWRRCQVPPKRRFLQEPHGVTTQKTPFFITGIHHPTVLSGIHISAPYWPPWHVTGIVLLYYYCYYYLHHHECYKTRPLSDSPSVLYLSGRCAQCGSNHVYVRSYVTGKAGPKPDVTWPLVSLWTHIKGTIELVLWERHFGCQHTEPTELLWCI
jgi:hypothetical protein